ncbi:NPCBM/NEW2 domain-containing protein [Deinococcus aquatilis]|uniref:NPCBM/NEW2 domain-containing protein n=1 Tax=Deinococcus aquatilis TaxID=519440 RepID=UPI00035FAE64|nr:NPCBM/NEW2 domain-containing protein [Deinococcus aquatilis]
MSNRLPRVLAGFTLPLVLFSCAQPDHAVAADPYANGQTYPWSMQRLTSQSLTPGVNTLQYETMTYARNSWGPVERNRSNGEQQAGDGKPLTLNGKVYAQGFGVHAGSEMRFSLQGIDGAQCQTFTADIGIDDEVSSRGSVQFQVFADGVQLYQSSQMVATSPTEHISVSVAGRKELRLVVTDGGNGISFDHADWADPKLVCVTLPPTPPTGAPGSLDLSFDTDGFVQQPVVSPAADADRSFSGLISLPSGQLITQTGFSVYRYNATGALDLTFGQGGFARPIGPPSQIFDLETQPTGHVLFSGIRRGLNQGFVERLLPSGLPDLSFGGQGNGTLTLSASEYHLAVQSDGRFLTAGISEITGGALRLVVRRFQASGLPDLTYGSSGRVVADVGLNPGEGYRIEKTLIQPDGKLIVGATAGPSFPDTSFHLTRFLPGGQLDSSFGRDGWLTSRPQGLPVEMTDVGLSPTGHLIVTGGVVVSPYIRGTMTRYSSSGNLDQTFGTSGSVNFDGLFTVKAAAVQTDGRVLLIFPDDGTPVSRDVVRLQADGRPDTSFGSAGRVRFNLQGLSLDDVTVQTDGRIVLGGGEGGRSADLIRLFP